MTTPRLLALSDLHVAHPQNREIVAGLSPDDDGDWLLLAGDVGELYPDIEWALRTLAGTFATVVWTPGNHELWTRRKDPVPLRGQARYLALVELCRSLGILTPEDPYPVWHGPGGPVTIAPVFLLYDYTFRPDGALTKEDGLKLAYEKGIICRDEALLHPDPHASVEDWCWARIEATEGRLAAQDPALPIVSPAHPEGDLVRRRPVRGGLARLPARMAAPRRPAGRPVADTAGAPDPPGHTPTLTGSEPRTS